MLCYGTPRIHSQVGGCMFVKPGKELWDGSSTLCQHHHNHQSMIYLSPSLFPLQGRQMQQTLLDPSGMGRRNSGKGRGRDMYYLPAQTQLFMAVPQKVMLPDPAFTTGEVRQAEQPIALVHCTLQTPPQSICLQTMSSSKRETFKQ